MIRRSLALALAAALASGSAQATDLLETYEMARNGDPQLAIAESSTLYDKEGEVQARAALLPQVTGDASLRRSRTEYEGTSGTFTTTSRSYGVNATQTLFNWGQFSSLRAQRSLSQAADFTLEAANDDLVVRTAAAYFDVLVAIESLAAAEANEAAGKRQFDYADKRLEVGLAPITDVHEARAQYDDARANTILVRNALADAYQALAELTGQPVQNLRGLPADFRPELPAVHADADGWVTRAVEKTATLGAVQRVAGLEHHDLAPAELLELGAQFVRRVAAAAEIVMHRRLDALDRPAEIDRMRLVVQVVDGRMRDVVGAEDEVGHQGAVHDLVAAARLQPQILQRAAVQRRFGMIGQRAREFLARGGAQ